MYLGTKVDLASVNTHGVSQYVDKCVLSKPVTSSQMCRVKGVLSHCCLRPGRNRILAPCQPSLLPSLSSPAAMTFNCELGVCVHTHKCMCVCVFGCACLGVHVEVRGQPQVLFLRCPRFFCWFVLRQGFSLACALPAGSEPRGSACLRLSSVGIASTCFLGQHFLFEFWKLNSTPVLSGQALCHLSCFLSPQCTF